MDNQGYEMSYQPAFHAYGNVLPLSVHPQWLLHPQSGLPDALAAAAPDALHAVGTHFGYPTTGLVAGHALAGAVRHIPFPQPPAHPGPIGAVVHTVAPPVFSTIGAAVGYPNAGQHLGNIVSEAARYSPFSAQPQIVLAPQGILGSLIGTLAPTVGHLVGGLVGHPNAGQQIGSVAGNVASLLPFSAQPQVTLAPQGILGSLIGTLAPTVGQVVGGLVGHPNAGQQIGSVAGHVASLLPFSAQPQVTLAPQGVFGDLIGALAPTVGNVVGGLVGHPNAGQQIGTVAGHIGSLLPFSAQPMVIYH
jgi:hypothetical protein